MQYFYILPPILIDIAEIIKYTHFIEHTFVFGIYFR